MDNISNISNFANVTNLTNFTLIKEFLMTFIELFKQGGFIMYPLMIFSIFIWTVALKKFFMLASFKRQYKKLYSNAMNVSKNDNLGELKWIFKNASQLIAAPW